MSKADSFSPVVGVCQQMAEFTQFATQERINPLTFNLAFFLTHNHSNCHNRKVIELLFTDAQQTDTEHDANAELDHV